jgi:hypothetical protein
MERTRGIGPPPSAREAVALPLRYVRTEPLPGVEPGDVSIPRTRGRRSEGRELAGLESNQRPRTVQSRGAPADRATGHQSPSPGSNWAGCPYKGPPDAGPKGIVRSAGVGPATSSTSCWRLCLIGLRAHGAAIRCRPGSPAVRERGRSRARRRSWGTWTRTRTSVGRLPVQSRACCQLHHSPLPSGRNCGRPTSRFASGSSDRGTASSHGGCQWDVSIYGVWARHADVAGCLKF